jgi:hypothetical protein
MFKCAIGHSHEIETADAVEAALRACAERLAGAPAKAALIFCGIDYDHALVVRTVTERYPGIALVGCTTDGELSTDLAFTHESVLIAMFASDTATFRSGVGHAISSAPADAAAAAVAAARLGDERPSLVFLVSDGLTGSGDAVVKGLQAALGADVPIVGGAAGDKRRTKATYQLHAGGVSQDSAAVLAVYGPIHASTGVESGWEPLGKRVVVTKSSGNVVQEIDGKPAIEFYRHYMGDYARGAAMPAYPLGIWPPNGEPFYVRSPIFIDDKTGAVIFSGEVLEGGEVQMMQVDRPNIVKGARASIAAAVRDFPGGAPAVVFVVSCTTRNEMLGTQVAEEHRIIQERAGDVPVFGFYAYGEYAPVGQSHVTRFHNETCVTVAIGER